MLYCHTFLKLTQTGVSFLFVSKVITVLLNFYPLYRVLTTIRPTHHSEKPFRTGSIHFYYLNGVNNNKCAIILS